MITFLWTALTSRLAGPIAAGVAVALTLALGVQSIRLHDAGVALVKTQDQLRQSESNLTTCRNNSTGLELSLKTQTTAVARLEREGAARLAKAESDLAAAQKGRAGAEARAAALLRTPPPGLDSCARMFGADEAVLGSLK